VMWQTFGAAAAVDGDPAAAVEGDPAAAVDGDPATAADGNPATASATSTAPAAHNPRAYGPDRTIRSVMLRFLPRWA
jgi:hypothetical protein